MQSLNAPKKPSIIFDPKEVGFTLQADEKTLAELERLREEYAKGWLRCQNFLLD